MGRAFYTVAKYINVCVRVTEREKERKREREKERKREREKERKREREKERKRESFRMLI